MESVRRGPLAAVTADTTTVASWNATLKDGIAGVGHWISIKHIGRYLTETIFRWSERDHDARLAILFASSATPLTLNVEFVA